MGLLDTYYIIAFFFNGGFDDSRVYIAGDSSAFFLEADIDVRESVNVFESFGNMTYAVLAHHTFDFDFHDKFLLS